MNTSGMHKKMIIRKATLKDAGNIATLLLLSMEDIIFNFINQKDYDTARAFLLHFVKQENNQYSYQNCLVAEEENQIIAAVNLYDGSKLTELRNPIIQYVRFHFNQNFNPEDETQSGEIYIDSLGVDPNQQGRGIGTKLLRFLIHEYAIQNQQILGLLVEEGNPQAKKLYLKLGFKPVGKKTLAGKNLEHLQFSNSK